MKREPSSSKKAIESDEADEAKMDLKATLRSHVNPGGFCTAASYVLIVVGVYAATALTTKPDSLGHEWIPSMLLAMPWYWLDRWLLLPGLIVNAALMYLLGAILQTFWRRVITR